MAYDVAAWLQRADQSGSVVGYFNTPLTPEEREVASVEGEIFGVDKAPKIATEIVIESNNTQKTRAFETI